MDFLDNLQQESLTLELDQKVVVMSHFHGIWLDHDTCNSLIGRQKEYVMLMLIVIVSNVWNEKLRLEHQSIMGQIKIIQFHPVTVVTRESCQ